MANCWIDEYDSLPFDSSGNRPPDNYRLIRGEGVSQVVTFTPGTSAQSAAFAASTRVLGVRHDGAAAATVLSGANPTAVAGSHVVGIGETVFVVVQGGHKLAVR